MLKKTLVFGASLNPNRYAHLAIHRLRNQKIDVVGYGLVAGKVADVLIDTEQIAYKNIHTVTLYLNPKRQPEYYSYIISLRPKRVIFNPGTENVAFVKLLEENGIETMNACTLVLVTTRLY